MNCALVPRMIAATIAAGVIVCGRVPPDWQHATKAQNFKQSACAAVEELSQRGGERTRVTSERGVLHVEYSNARFRCDQAATAYVKVHESTVDILVEPANMHPFTVAKCDCLYDIHLDVPGIRAGTWTVTLQRRGDDRQSPNDPVQIGTVRVEVR